MSQGRSQQGADAHILACCAPQAGVSVCLDLSCAEVVQQHAQLLCRVLQQGLVTLCIATMVSACAWLLWHRCTAALALSHSLSGIEGLWRKALCSGALCCTCSHSHSLAQLDKATSHPPAWFRSPGREPGACRC